MPAQLPGTPGVRALSNRTPAVGAVLLVRSSPPLTTIPPAPSARTEKSPPEPSRVSSEPALTRTPPAQRWYGPPAALQTVSPAGRVPHTVVPEVSATSRP